MLKLNEELLVIHSNLLHLGEAFIFCHELAHFLNGDLDDQSNFVSLGRDKIAAKYVEGKNHEIEYKADIKGYQILSTYMSAEFPGGSDELRMAPVVMLMDVLEAIGIRESYTHPSPKDRVINIAESCYGGEVAKFWKSSYSMFKK
ncbi:MAG: hypothetical protein HY530_06400 [Chloroflexi bacterium]|nr:hypothetical protein [Chloroflexota bacterium]